MADPAAAEAAEEGQFGGGLTEENMDMLLPHCVELWEVELDEAVNSVSLSPKGKLAAVATAYDDIVVLDTETGHFKVKLDGHFGGTNCVQFLSGAVLVSCGEDGKIKLWNIAHKTCIKEFTIDGLDADRTPSGDSVPLLTVAPGGLHFAVASGKSVSLFTVATAPATASNVSRRDFPPLKSTVEALKFDKKHGNLMAGYNGGVTLWDLSTRSEDEAQALDFPYDGACLSVDAHPSMEWVVGGCHDATVHIWNLTPKEGDNTGLEVHEMSCGGYERAVKFIDFDATGKWMASAGGTRGTIWDYSGPNGPAGSVPTLTLGHAKTVTCQAWQPDEPYLLATGAKDGRILFHNVEDIYQQGEPNLCLPGVTASPDNQGDDEATVIAWSVDGLFLVGYVSGVLKGWRLPEDYSSSSSGEEEEEEGDEERNENEE